MAVLLNGVSPFAVYRKVLPLGTLFFLNRNKRGLFPVFISPVLTYRRKEGFNMSVILKTIHDLDKSIEVHAEHFVFKHPYLSFFTLFIGIPICVLAAVFFFTVIITVPIALIFGWL